MGNRGATKERRHDKKIDKQLRKDKHRTAIPKILVLGTTEAGKSTVVKQLRIIHKHTFLPEELANLKEIIIQNIVKNMKILVDHAEKENCDLMTVKGHADAVTHVASDSSTVTYWNEEFAERIRQLWKSQPIQKIYRKRGQLRLTDCIDYFFDHVNRIGTPNYEPNQQDIIRASDKTTGVHEYVLQSEDGVKMMVIDIGGDRSERMKWANQFETVISVLFIVSLSEYDQMVLEDGSVNRMHESLEVFHQVCNNVNFRNMPMVIFLNKMDLFVEKLNSVKLSVCFEDYKGNSVESAVKFVEQKFISKNENPKRSVFTHTTCATDTNLVKKLFLSIRNSILQRSIEALGFE